MPFKDFSAQKNEKKNINIPVGSRKTAFFLN